jgi:hypothetical protein
MRMSLARVALSILMLALAAAIPAHAQDSSGVPTNPQDAAKKLFQAIADNNLDNVKAGVENHYAKKLTAAELRPVPTGPKLDVAFDGNVKVLRQGDEYAVVAAPNFFKPQASTEVPAGEVSQLDAYLTHSKWGWLASAPDRKQAAADADIGGFYHHASFTFCPNRGMVFQPNHFSSKVEDESTAVCR